MNLDKLTNSMKYSSKVEYILRVLSYVPSIAVVMAGLHLRYYRVVNELIWGEEAIYLGIARAHSLLDILFVKHWLIDHPQLYLVFMDFWSMLGTDPIWLRAPNLVVYLLSAYIVFKIANLLFTSSLVKFILLGFYCLMPYFVGIEWQAVPYSFAIFFFWGTTYSVLSLIKSSQSREHLYSLIVFLTLFLYTSFESLFLVTSIFVFLMILYIFSLAPFEKLKMLSLGVLLPVILFLPEVIIVLFRLKEFPKLAGHFVEKNYQIWTLLERIFLLQKTSILAYVFAAIVVLCGCRLLLRCLNIRVLALFVLSIFVTNFAVINFISNNFFEIRHPRGLYLAVATFGILILFMVEAYGRYLSSLKYLPLLLIILLISPNVDQVNENWLRAGYTYRRQFSESILLRDELVLFLRQKQMDHTEMYVMLDDNIPIEDWYEGVYLYDYYFKCLDLGSQDHCNLIQDSQVRVRNLLELANLKEMNLVGIFVSNNTRGYFLDEICQKQQSCYLWNLNQKKFEVVAK